MFVPDLAVQYDYETPRRKPHPAARRLQTITVWQSCLLLVLCVLFRCTR